jgi:hypothetical protein
MGHPVAGEELADADRVGGAFAADDAHARSDLDQDRLAGQEGAQDQLGEILVVGEQAPQARDRHVDHLAGIAHDRRQVDAAAGEEAELAQEAVRAVDRHHAVLHAVSADDRDRAGLDHEQVIARVALLVEDLARLDRAHLADRP